MYGGMSTYQQGDPIHSLYESALSFYKEGDFSEAMTRLNQVLKIDPNHLGAICKLAHIQYSMKNFPEAEELYNKALGIDPHNEDALKGLADVIGQMRTMGATSVEQLQEEAKHLQPLASHVISLGNTPLSASTESEMYQVSNIIDQLRIDLGSMWEELLDVDCQLFSAEKNLPATQPLVKTLEAKQVELLKLLDVKVNPMKFDFLASVPISNQVRCITWLVGRDILAPFVTCIVENKMHVMMYNIRAAFSLENITLKLVLGDCLCDIALTTIPQNVSSTAILVILPKIEVNNKETQILGAKIMLFLDPSLKERNIKPLS